VNFQGVTPPQGYLSVGLKVKHRLKPLDVLSAAGLALMLGAGHDKALGVPSVTHLAPMLKGWVQQGTQHICDGLPGSHARG
jgi:hypothetical protein